MVDALSLMRRPFACFGDAKGRHVNVLGVRRLLLARLRISRPRDCEWGASKESIDVGGQGLVLSTVRSREPFDDSAPRLGCNGLVLFEPCARLHRSPGSLHPPLGGRLPAPDKVAVPTLAT